eukprot:COSAG01_NODE_64965_length_274_cov_2.360000_1_plen_27_part_10
MEPRGQRDNGTATALPWAGQYAHSPAQ